MDLMKTAKLQSVLLVMFLITAFLFGCMTAPTSSENLHGSPTDRAFASTVTELFFGLSSKDGKGVSEQAWEGFLAEVVTPRFPQGLTVMEARGKWQEGDNKKIVTEASKMLLIVHDGGNESHAKLEAIIAEYKRRFDQESVLRVDTPAKVSF